jgi:hypothetical protein
MEFLRGTRPGVHHQYLLQSKREWVSQFQELIEPVISIDGKWIGYRSSFGAGPERTPWLGPRGTAHGVFFGAAEAVSEVHSGVKNMPIFMI